MNEVNTATESPYLEIAIQTVLYHYRDQLQAASSYEDEELFKEMASEISSKACQYKRITDITLKQLEE